MLDLITDQSDSLTTLVPYSAREHTRRALLLSEMVFVSSATFSCGLQYLRLFLGLAPTDSLCTCLTIHSSHPLQTPKLSANRPPMSTNSVIPRFLGRSFSHLCEVPVFLTVVCPYGRYREYYSPSRSGRLSVAFAMRSRCFNRPTHSIPNRRIFEFMIRS